MKPGWFIGFLMAFFLCSLFCGIYEMAYIGYNESSTIYSFLNPFSLSWTAVSNVISFNYKFFYGEWNLVRMFCCCISGGFIITLVILVVQTIGSAVGSAIGSFLRLFKGV